MSCLGWSCDGRRRSDGEGGPISPLPGSEGGGHPLGAEGGGPWKLESLGHAFSPGAPLGPQSCCHLGFGQ